MRKHPATGFVFVSNLDYLMWQWYMCDTAESFEAKDPTALLLQTTRRRYSNRAKLGPEQGTKQPIPPTFIKN